MLRRHAESTPAIATALNPYIGYDLGDGDRQGGREASERTIREVAIEKGVDEETLDKALDLRAMARGTRHGPSRRLRASAPRVRSLRPAGVELAPSGTLTGRASLHRVLAIGDPAAVRRSHAAATVLSSRYGIGSIGAVVAAHLEVQVRTGGVAGRAHVAESVSRQSPARPSRS